MKEHILCKLFGHDEIKFDSVQVDDGSVVSDELSAGDFNFPVMVHRFKCKRCGHIRESYPDLPGSCGGKYKVHYG